MPGPREHVATRTTRLGALASPPFARFLSGQVVSQVGTQISNTAGAWILYRLTHSPLALGLQGLCFSAPIAVLPLVTGILADRFSRLTLVKATLATEAGQAFVLALIATAGDLRPWMLYLAAATDACRLAVNIPAQSALVPNVVPADMLLSAMALSSSTWSSAALVGPAIAGLLLPVTGPGPIFAVNGACTLVALGAVASLRRTVPAQPIDGNGFAQLTGGIAYLRSHRLVLWLEGVMLIAMTGALGVETLLPVFAAGTWHTGSAGYGLLRMAPGIAALLAGLGLSMFSAAGQGALIIGVAFAGASAGMVAFAAGPSVRPGPPPPGHRVTVPGRDSGHRRHHDPAGHSRCATGPDQRTGISRAERAGRPRRRSHVRTGGHRRPGWGRHRAGRNHRLRGHLPRPAHRTFLALLIALLVARVSRRCIAALPIRPTRPPGPPTLPPGAHAALKGAARRLTGSRRLAGWQLLLRSRPRDYC